MARPKGWTRTWINDDCHCEAMSLYDWLEQEPGQWRPVLKRFHFQRALFCGVDHEAEISIWQKMVDLERDPFPAEYRFPIKGNSEGG